MGWNALLFIYLQNQVLNINYRTQVTIIDDKLLLSRLGTYNDLLGK